MGKFQDDYTEQLYERSLDQGHDEETGEVDAMGWFAIFRDELTIINQTSQGFVYSQIYESAEEMETNWERIVADGNDTCNECGAELPELGLQLCSDCEGIDNDVGIRSQATTGAGACC